ncbi:MAG: FKBP-type peptidyl-prolyl cis-trans isomerase [Cellvibrionaceae bacterium]
MKNVLKGAVLKSTVIATAVLLAACNKEAAAPQPITLETVEQKASYAIGVQFATQFKAQNIEIDVDALKLGLSDRMSGAEIKLDEQQQEDAMQAFQKTQMKKQAEAFKTVSENNLKEGAAFLAENAKKEGVQATESGLQYKVVTEGAGSKPTAEDTVTVHYRGTLTDGTEFDSSYGRGEPATFPVQGVIPGWTEALQLMPEGSKWELYIPAALAYGERGAGAQIGPNQVLIFEVELLKAKAEG